jgi:succinyl-CoA synthetase beta subunit
VRCDVIAEGIVQAVREVGDSVPVIVRLEGTNADQARKVLAASKLAITAARDLSDAAKKAVRLAKQGRRP